MVKIKVYQSAQIYARPELVKRLKFLTNGGWGRVSSSFHYDLSCERAGTFFLAWEKGEVIGWSLATPRYGAEGTQVGVYVARKHRGKGVADRLIVRAKKHLGWKLEYWKENRETLVACPWTSAGVRLFAKHFIPTRTFWC